MSTDGIALNETSVMIWSMLHRQSETSRSAAWSTPNWPWGAFRLWSISYGSVWSSIYVHADKCIGCTGGYTSDSNTYHSIWQLGTLLAKSPHPGIRDKEPLKHLKGHFRRSITFGCAKDKSLLVWHILPVIYIIMIASETSSHCLWQLCRRGAGIVFNWKNCNMMAKMPTRKQILSSSPILSEN